MYEIFFEMELIIVRRFPSVSPFQIRREKAAEVFRFVKRLIRYDRRQAEQKKTEESGDGKVIRRPAGDNWF